VPEDRPPTSLGGRRDRQAAAAAPAAAPAEPQAASGAPAAPGADAAALEPQPVPEDRPPTSLGRRRDRQAAAPAPPAADGDISVAPLDATAPGAAAPAVGAVRFPFIQAATFSSEANARAAADRLRAAGVTAEIRRDGSVWRVLAGPVSSAAEQASVLEKVKGLGYSDAYPVRG
jgi:cell division septation protein DedD